MLVKQHRYNVDVLYSRILLEKENISELFQQLIGMLSHLGINFSRCIL